MAAPLVTDEQRRWRMVRRHHLDPGTRVDDLAELVDDLVAVHSSDPATVYLSLLARMASPSITAIEAALYERRVLVRHHAMRRTMWVMTPNVARRAHAAATEKIAAAERKRTLNAFSEAEAITDAELWLDSATDELVAELEAKGPQSTRELGKTLPHLTVPIVFGVNTKNPGSIRAHTKVLQGAGFAGLIVRTEPTGGWTSSEYRWSTTSSWLDAPLTGEETDAAAAELLHHWLRRFGPATDVDIRWWFGWTATLANRSLEAIDATRVRLENGGDAWVAQGDDVIIDLPEPSVRLLPGLDASTMGWKERDWYLDPAMTPRLFDRFGNAGPTIVVDGQVVGGWIQNSNAEIVLDLLRDLNPTHTQLVKDAVDQLRSGIGDVIVRPRFPSPNQKELLGRS